MRIKDKPKTNWIPTDLARGYSTPSYGFSSDSKAMANSAFLPKFTGLLAEKNFADLIQNDEIRNKDASYIIGGRLFDAVVDGNGGGDYLTIQEALTSGKTKIFLRSGTYLIDSTIDLTDISEVKIIGESKFSTKITNNGFTNAPLFAINKSAEFSNLFLQGLSNTGSIGIESTTASYVVIENCQYSSFADSAIKGSFSFSKILKNDFGSSLNHINLTGDNNVVNKNIIIIGFVNSSVGINISSGKNIITENTLYYLSGTGTTGIKETGSADYNLIKNNMIDTSLATTVTIVGANTAVDNMEF